MALIWFDRPFPEVPAVAVARRHHELIGPDDARLVEADAAIIGGAQWDGAMMDRAPRLRFLARTGIGVDAVDLDEAARRNIVVTNTPDGPTVSTAEHTLALLFAIAKTLPQHQDRLRRQVGGYVQASTAVELDGLTIGLLGYGRIARRVGAMAAAIGMSVITHDPFVTAIDPSDPAGARWVDFEQLLAESDVVSLHAPLTSESAGLFDAAVFERCRPGLLFVNCARGGLVDHDALVAALATGRVAAAGLDVTNPEPLPADHPLLALDNVIVTPHVASSTVAGRERMLAQALEQVMIGLGGATPPHTVNGVTVTDRSA